MRVATTLVTGLPAAPSSNIVTAFVRSSPLRSTHASASPQVATCTPAMKLFNNFMAGVHVATWGEALAWVERSGLDRTKAVTMLLEGAAGSPVTKVVATRIEAGDYTPNFLLRLMAKDLGY